MKLYHATYKPRLRSILTKGLGAGGKKNWEDSVAGTVYLAIDPDIAESYAESADLVNEDWLAHIIILEVDSKNLDQKLLRLDKNIIGNSGESFEYNGIILPKDIRIFRK